MAAYATNVQVLCLLLVFLSLAVWPVYGECLIRINRTGTPTQRFALLGNRTQLLQFQRHLRCKNDAGCRQGCALNSVFVRLQRGRFRGIFRCTCRGAATGDPKFQGFDGSIFWFHGKREMSWCISSDENLHVNAYFSGKPAEEMANSKDPAAQEGPKKGKPHDLTWVQKLAFLFGRHKLLIEAVQEAGWDKRLEHLKVSFDGRPVELPPFTRHRDPQATPWTLIDRSHNVSLIRVNTKNQMKLEIAGLVSAFIKVIPTSNRTWTSTNSFVHIDAEYTFLSPTPAIDGVLGRTLRLKNPQIEDGRNRKSSINGKLDTPYFGVGILEDDDEKDKAATPYILWDLNSYSTSNLTAADCKVSQFNTNAIVPPAGQAQAGTPNEPKHIACGGQAGPRGMACR